MGKTLLESSQENFGIILKRLRPPEHYNPQFFFYPYDEMVEYMLKNKDWRKEDLYQQWANSFLDDALKAAAPINGQAREIDYPAMLRETYLSWDMGKKFEQAGKALQKGNKPDLLPLYADLRTFNLNEGSELQRASEVDLSDIVFLQLSGWKIIDETFGGIPASGPLVVYGTMGTGKTFWTAKLINEFLHFYPEKHATIFSLEMGKKEYIKRSFDMYPTMEEVANRLWVSGRATDMKSIIAATSTQEKVDIVVIDGIADTIYGEKDASKFDEAYTDVKRMGRLLGIPVVVVAQPNRRAKLESMTRFLERYDIEWTGAAENAAAQLIALQYIRSEAEFTDEKFPVFSDAYYMISWKQRGGWPAQKGPGAVILKDHKYTPRDEVRLWEGDAYQNTLWYPDACSRTIGKKSKRKAEEEL